MFGRRAIAVWIIDGELLVDFVASAHNGIASEFWPSDLYSRPQVSRIALARKLLTAVWALLRDGDCFDECAFAERG